MSKGAGAAADAYDPTTLEDESISTAQEAIPAPWFWGTVQEAPRYITEINGQRTQEHPKATQGKK